MSYYLLTNLADATNQNGCYVNGQPASCGKALGIIAAIGIPLLLIGMICLVVWVLALIHLITHKDVPNRALWAVLLLVVNLPTAIVYYFMIMRPYKKNHPNGVVGAAEAVRNITDNVAAMAQNPPAPPAPSPQPSNQANSSPADKKQ